MQVHACFSSCIMQEPGACALPKYTTIRKYKKNKVTSTRTHEMGLEAGTPVVFLDGPGQEQNKARAKTLGAILERAEADSWSVPCVPWTTFKGESNFPSVLHLRKVSCFGTLSTHRILLHRQFPLLRGLRGGSPTILNTDSSVSGDDTHY